MSDLILHAVLQMPPDLWSGSALDVTQRHGSYLQASRRIENDALEIEMLRDLLLLILYHHQGGSSEIGQPIRRALGIGKHDRLTTAQIEAARVSAMKV